jgi:hypothetical protein
VTLSGGRAKSIIGVPPVLRDEGWESVDGTAVKIRLLAWDIALSGGTQAGRL